MTTLPPDLAALRALAHGGAPPPLAKHYPATTEVRHLPGRHDQGNHGNAYRRAEGSTARRGSAQDVRERQLTRKGRERLRGVKPPPRLVISSRLDLEDPERDEFLSAFFAGESVEEAMSSVTPEDLEEWRNEWLDEFPEQDSGDGSTGVPDEYVAGWHAEWETRPWRVADDDTSTMTEHVSRAPEGVAQDEWDALMRSLSSEGETARTTRDGQAAETAQQRSARRRRDRDSTLRASYDDYVQKEHDRAEAATRGAMLSAAGRRAGVSTMSLFYGKLPRRFASEELLAYWGDENASLAQNGAPRLTFGQWKRASTMGRYHAFGKALQNLLHREAEDQLLTGGKAAARRAIVRKRVWRETDVVRDSNGRFARVGSNVSVAGGEQGTISRVNRDGTVDVRTVEGQTRRGVPSGDLTVQQGNPRPRTGERQGARTTGRGTEVDTRDTDATSAPEAASDGGRAAVGLDDRWRMAGGTEFSTPLSKLRAGDRVYTSGQGTQASPVELPVRRGSLSAYQQVPRTVASVTRLPDGNVAVRFTDGTSAGTGEDVDGANRYGPRTAVFAAWRPEHRATDAAEATPTAVTVPELPNAAAAAAFVAERAGVPDLERDLALALSPRRTDASFDAGRRVNGRMADDPQLERLVIAARQGRYRTAGSRPGWQGERARAALERVASNDPTAPLNLLGQRVALDVIDQDAPIRVRLSAGPQPPRARKRVTGRITQVGDAAYQGVYLRLEGDDGQEYFEAVPVDASIENLNAPTPAPDEAPDDQPAPEPTPVPDPATRELPEERPGPTASRNVENVTASDLEVGDRYVDLDLDRILIVDGVTPVAGRDYLEVDVRDEAGNPETVILDPSMVLGRITRPTRPVPPARPGARRRPPGRRTFYTDEQGTTRARPAVRAYQRAYVGAYRMDTDHPDRTVRQAAARVRNYEPLSAAEARALADALRAQVEQEQPRRAAALRRTAEAYDRLDTHLAAREGNWIERRSLARDLQPGMQVRMPRIVGREPLEGRVVGVRRRQAGQLTEVTVEDDGGNREARLLMSGTSVTVTEQFVRTPEPEPTPEPGPAEVPDREDTPGPDEPEVPTPEPAAPAEPTPVPEPVRDLAPEGQLYADEVEAGTRIVLGDGFAQEVTAADRNEAIGVILTLRGQDGGEYPAWFGPDALLRLAEPDDPEGPQIVAARKLVVGQHVTIDHPGRPIAGRITEVRGLSNGFVRVTVDPENGGRVRSVTLDGDDNVVLLPNPGDPEPLGNGELPDGAGSTATVIPHGELQVGDVIRITNGRTGEDYSGRVLSVDERYDYTDEGETVAVTRFTLLWDDGSEVSHTVADGDTVVLVDRAGEVEGQRIAQERLTAQLTDGIGRAMTSYQREVLSSVLGEVTSLTYRLQGGFRGDPSQVTGAQLADALLERHRQGMLASRARYQRDRLVSDLRERMYGGGLPNQGALRAAEAPLGTFADSLLERAVERIAESYRQAGSGGLDGVTAVLRSELDGEAPPNVIGSFDAERRRLAETVIANRGEVTATPDVVADPSATDAPAPAGSLAERVAAYRSRLPVVGGFGAVTTRRKVYAPFTIADLEAGRTPVIVSAMTPVLDRAEDGGPGHTALRHLEVVRGAGRELLADVQARVTARMGDAGDTAQLTTEVERAQALLDEAMKARSAAASEARSAVLRAAGFDSLDALTARRLARDTSSDERARLTELHNNASAAYNATILASRDAIAEAKQQRDEAQARLRAAQSATRTARAEAALEVLREVRQMGPTGGARLTFSQGERAEAVKNLRWAEERLPTDWLEPNRMGEKQILTGTTSRGNFRERGKSGGPEIRLSQKQATPLVAGAGKYGDVAIHELTHLAEFTVPDLTVAEDAFLWSRTTDADTEVGQRKRTGKNASKAHRRGESGREDEFRSWYTGKTYGDVARDPRRAFHEVLTQGVEALFGGAEYLDGDDDYAAFTLGSLALLGGPSA